jgi:hypothetical protein
MGKGRLDRIDVWRNEELQLRERGSARGGLTRAKLGPVRITPSKCTHRKLGLMARLASSMRKFNPELGLC